MNVHICWSAYVIVATMVTFPDCISPPTQCHRGGLKLTLHEIRVGIDGCFKMQLSALIWHISLSNSERKSQN